MEIVTLIPGTPPVSLDTLKLHLSMNDDSTDELLTEWLQAAVEVLSDATGYIPTASHLQAILTEWPEGNIIRVPRKPIDAITVVTFWDTDGNDTDLTATSTINVHAGKITLPTARPAGKLDRITVDFESAGTVEQCPARFKVAVKLLAAHYYANREAYNPDTLNEVPVGMTYLVQQLRGSLGVGQ